MTVIEEYKHCDRCLQRIEGNPFIVGSKDENLNKRAVELCSECGKEWRMNMSTWFEYPLRVEHYVIENGYTCKNCDNYHKCYKEKFKRKFDNAEYCYDFYKRGDMPDAV